MKELCPKLVVALGIKNWNNFPEFDHDPKPFSLRAGGKRILAGYYTTTRGAKALAIGIMHPSSSRFSASQWTPLVEKAIEKARAI